MSREGHAWHTDTRTLQAIVPRGSAAYARRHAVPAHGRRAVGALLAWRTARWGGQVQACPEGHVERLWDNACRHRRCPPCAWVQVDRWLTKPKARLLVGEHDPVSLTMPQALNDLWLAHIGGMSQLLLSSVHHTWLARLGERK